MCISPVHAQVQRDSNGNHARACPGFADSSIIQHLPYACTCICHFQPYIVSACICRNKLNWLNHNNNQTFFVGNPDSRASHAHINYHACDFKYQFPSTFRAFILICVCMYSPDMIFVGVAREPGDDVTSRYYHSLKPYSCTHV